MNKTEFIELLKLLNVAFNEGIVSDINKNSSTKIYFWEILWTPITASGIEYNTEVTYQVSFFSDISRDPKLIELKHLLSERGIFVQIKHEYVEEKRSWHSYFGIDILENV